jgi:hypothetical protein
LAAALPAFLAGFSLAAALGMLHSRKQGREQQARRGSAAVEYACNHSRFQRQCT